VLALVHKQPGITIAELAKRMKIKPNYLYRVLPHLERDGKLRKRDKGYHPPDT
jgi:DNA-binding IscR family transcriptional regulator